MIIVMWLRHILKINIIKICDFLTTSMSATPMVFTRRSKDSIDIFLIIVTSLVIIGAVFTFGTINQLFLFLLLP